jgi:hypothetical protein
VVKLPPPVKTLVLYCDHERVGELRDTAPMGFEYDAAWAGRVPPRPLAAWRSRRFTT